MSLRIALIALGGALILVPIAAYLLGSRLPATRSATASLAIESTTQEIMAVLSDVTSQPAWRPDVLSVEVRSADRWTEQRRGGESITFRVVSRSDLILELSFESSRGYHGRWRGQVSAGPNGLSTVIQVEESATVEAPLQRVLARVLFDPEKFSAEYLARLKTEVRRRSAAASQAQGEVGRK